MRSAKKRICTRGREGRRIGECNAHGIPGLFHGKSFQSVYTYTYPHTQCALESFWIFQVPFFLLSLLMLKNKKYRMKVGRKSLYLLFRDVLQWRKVGLELFFIDSRRKCIQYIIYFFQHDWKNRYSMKLSTRRLAKWLVSFFLLVPVQNSTFLPNIQPLIPHHDHPSIPHYNNIPTL